MINEEYFMKLKKMLIFGSLLAIVSGGYLEFLISGAFNLQNRVWTTSGEIFSQVLGYLVLGLAFWYSSVSVWLSFKEQVHLDQTTAEPTKEETVES